MVLKRLHMLREPVYSIIVALGEIYIRPLSLSHQKINLISIWLFCVRLAVALLGPFQSDLASFSLTNFLYIQEYREGNVLASKKLGRLALVYIPAEFLTKRQHLILHSKSFEWDSTEELKLIII